MMAIYVMGTFCVHEGFHSFSADRLLRHYCEGWLFCRVGYTRVMCRLSKSEFRTAYGDMFSALACCGNN